MRGEPFIIAKAGKPMVRVSAMEPEKDLPRSGFMCGEIKLPRDFNTMMEEDIEEMFHDFGSEDPLSRE